MKLTKIQQKIFNKVLKEWEKRIGKGNVDEETLADIIQFTDTNGDGKKRIRLFDEKKFRLVPIEDIILNGIKGTDLKKYPVEKIKIVKKICKKCKFFDQSTYLEDAGWCDLEMCKRVYHNDTCNKFKSGKHLIKTNHDD